MAANLRDRLKRIQELKKDECPRNVRSDSPDISAFLNRGWVLRGFQTLEREVFTDALDIQAVLPSSLPVLVPDLRRRTAPLPEDFLFFDLETTGLSGGAGTVAFLAAFGQFVSGGGLRITQYLLLDYPGENDFLEAVLEKFKDRKSVIVSYNGKCFDSQILKTRCLMNGITPPEYSHVDLLHPARRLWKTVTGCCSQGAIETRILGLDRSGDTPGALAPEIWFDFLRTGAVERLFGICDHNVADIYGLASILRAMISIAADPFSEKYAYDQERLALYWRGFTRFEHYPPVADFDELRETGNRLLRLAAEKSPRACFVYAQDQLHSGNYEEGRYRLHRMSESAFPEETRAAALRLLAVDSERRLKRFEEALEFAKRGAELQSAGAAWRVEFERRAERLRKKLQAAAPIPG